MMKLLRILLIGITITACQTKTEPQKNPHPSAASDIARNVSLLVNPGTAIPDRIPNFTWKDGSGKEISFAEFSKGRPVLINFWATWCGPCVRETPDLVELYHELRSTEALFIGISADLGDDAKELVTGFIQKYNVPYQIVIDNNGELQETIGGLRGYPTTIYIDKTGKIVKVLIGMQSKQRFAEEFKPIL